MDKEMLDILASSFSDMDAEEISKWQQDRANQIIKVVKVIADTILLKMMGDFLEDYADPTKDLTSDDLEELERVMNIVNLALRIRE